MPKTHIDHITITAPTLEAGAELVERTLGVAPQVGGEHLKMATHNLFVRLGESLFLEIIASNPKAPKPARPRWFALDVFDVNDVSFNVNHAEPALRAWVARTDNIQTSVANCSEALGEIEPMSRDAIDWLITIPADGGLPLAGAAPALIQWHADSNGAYNEPHPHPAIKLKDVGLSLIKLQITHPEPKRLTHCIESLGFLSSLMPSSNPQIKIEKGDEIRLEAHIKTPNGVKILSD